MKRIDFIGQIDEKGAGRIYNREQLNKFFSFNPGKRFTAVFEIEKMKMNESDQGYYFKVVVNHWQILLRELGYSYTKEQTHEYIKQFSPIMIEEVFLGEICKPSIKSITELEEQEFRVYIEDLKRIAGEHGEYIPDKGEL